MTKADIVENVYEKVGGFSKKEAAEIVETVFDTIKETLERGEKIKISGFGNFVVRDKNARAGRNPQTGQEITIRALTEQICDLCGFQGEIDWDASKPDGQPRRCLDTRRAREEFGFQADTSLRHGLQRTIAWYERRRAAVAAPQEVVADSSRNHLAMEGHTHAAIVS